MENFQLEMGKIQPIDKKKQYMGIKKNKAQFIESRKNQLLQPVNGNFFNKTKLFTVISVFNKIY